MKKMYFVVVGILTAAALMAGSGVTHAQAIDAGRGELPLTVPSGDNAGTASPLIVLLHTYGRTGAIQDEYMGLSALADAYGFILVAPDGTPSTAENNPRYWNASAACCVWDQEALDDSAYIASIIDLVKADYEVDPKRVYILGHSNGGFMAHRLAHEHSGTIAAIASIAGPDQSDERPTPPNPVHVLHIHGDADTAIAYEGGEIRGGTYPGARQSVENWAARNGCSAEGRDAGTLDLDRTLDGMESTVTRYTSSCKAGGSAELWTIAGGAHIPELSDHFTRLVVEWLLAHPKP
ncbi:MAG: alpha/beta hydrolase-fold protein [Acidobacteria bacterium]|nr:alpha/beta hydrolase-fold protein [Acidobacteriota bacterium]